MMANEDVTFSPRNEIAATTNTDAQLWRPTSHLYRPPESPVDASQQLHERVPVELWAIIFVDCLPSSHDFPKLWASLFDGAKLTDPPLIPMVLTSVCRTWRHVACNTPCLWEVCWLSYKNPKLNDIWLSRAGTRMLSLYGQSTMRTYMLWGADGRKEASIAFMRSILPHRKRWKFVKLDILPLAHPLPDIVHIGDEASTFPALEYFEESGPRGYDPENPPTESTPTWVTSILSSASSLQHLRLCDVTSYTLEQQKLPQLTHLEIDRIGASDALLILSTLPHLQQLSFHVLRPTEDYDQVVHKGLVQLCITEDPGNEEESTILDYLHVPSLCQLDTKNVPITAILACLDDSQCHLTDLKISHKDRTLSDDSLLAILELDGVDSSLKSLEVIDVAFITFELLGLLQYDSENPRLIFLERLSFKNCAFINVADGMLANCIASRCSGSMEKGAKQQVAQLRHVFLGTVDIPNNWNPSLWHTQDLACFTPLSQLQEQPDAENSRYGELVYRARRNSKQFPNLTSIYFSLGQPEAGVYTNDGLE